MNLSLVKAKITEKSLEEQTEYTISFDENITTDELLDNLNKIYTLEESDEFKDIVFTRLKNLNVDLIIEALRISLTRETLKDPLMLLNIINLVKVYNTLEDSFFEDENIYFNNMEDLLDVRLELREEVNAFSKQLSIYFISLIKSYSKTTFLPTDEYISLPAAYKSIILSTDFYTLSGIFAAGEQFDTANCPYVIDAMECLSTLFLKNSVSLNLFENFAKNAKDTKESKDDE
ncbi:MAG: hypothetical protein ACI4V7_05355 [Succinivibrionaceae bacterium]